MRLLLRTGRTMVALAAALAAGVAGAVEPPVPPPAGPAGANAVTIEELVQLAVEANPAIGAATAEIAGVQARSAVETAFSDPSLTATWWPEDAADGKQEMWEVMLEQSFPFPGKLGAVGSVREAEEGAARINLQRAVRDVTLRVRESAAELEYLRAAGRIAAGNRELLDRLRAAGESGYAAGATGLYDAMRAQSQQSQAEFDGRLFAELEVAETARLNSLLSRPPETAIGPIELHAGRPVAATPAEIVAWAGSGRQEVLLAREEGKRASAEGRVADREALPELMLGVGYEQENALEEMQETNRWKFEFGVTLPLNFGKNDGRRSAAGAGVARAAAMEREAADMARADVSETWFRFRNAERLAALYRESLLPQAVASLRLAETWHRAGQGSFSDLVEAGTLWYSFQLALARAGADREKYLARLESLAERPLTGDPPAAGAASPVSAGEDAWTEALARLEGEREALAAEDASPFGRPELLVPDPGRAQALAPAAEDDAAAAAALAAGVALADVEILALLRSPAVRAAQRSARASLEQYGQVAALDDVVRRYATATGSLMSGAGGAMGEAAARFPFPGMLALKGQVVAQDVRAALAGLDLARRDALAEARRLYWSLALAHRAAALLGELRGLEEQRVQAVRARYEAGQGALADLTQAQVELERTRTELETAAQERGVVEAQLLALLALPRGTTLGEPGGVASFPPAAGIEPLTALALERRQELRRMRAMAARMELMLQMAEREITPGFALGASVFENQPLRQDGAMAPGGAGGGAAPAVAEGAGTPLRAFAGRTAGYVRETRERLAALREEIRAEEQEAAARVRETWFSYGRAAREERLWSQQVAELTRLASETQDRAYRAGRATLPEALAAAVEARGSALEAERRRAALGESWAALEAAVGAPLAAAGEGK